MQPQKWQNDLCLFPRQTIHYHSILSLCPKHRWWRSWTALWRPTRPSRTNTKNRYCFHRRGLECKSGKSGETWINRQVWPRSTKWQRAKATKVLSREHTSHSKHPFQQPKRWFYTWTSSGGQCWNLIDFILCSQPEMEEHYTVLKQDLELTVAQIMSSSLQNSVLNWRK